MINLLRHLRERVTSACRNVTHWTPVLNIQPLTILSTGILVSAIARGIDFLGSPHDQSATLSAIAQWASPTVLGVILIVLGVIALLGMVFHSPAVQAIAHIALSAVFLVMGAVSFLPVVHEVGWGWRAPVSYIFGSSVVHWFVAHSWFNRWVVKRGRSELDS